MALSMRGNAHGADRRRMGSAQALVEFALVAPILMLLAMVVWDGGSILREQVVLQTAAREGARVAATGYGATVPAATINNAVLISARDLPQLSTTPNYVTVSYPDARSVSVTVQYRHGLFTPILRNLWGNSGGVVVLHASAVFYLPTLTPVPATVVASTPLPTSTPSPVPPTATPSPTPITPTATPTPGPCTYTVAVPGLSNKRGYYLTFSTAAAGPISATWNLPDGSGNPSLDVYQNNPFSGDPNPDNVSPPAGSLGSGQPILSTMRVTTLTRPAGTYTIYLYEQGPAFSASTATLTYATARCP